MTLKPNDFLILGKFEIRNSVTGKYLSFKKTKVTISDSNTEWQWVPKEGHGAWGFIHNSNDKYLTVSKCPDKKSPCSLKLKNFDGKIEQLWRKWNNKIISKRNMNRKDKVVVLTLNSDDNVNAKTPNNDENQDWIVSELIE